MDIELVLLAIDAIYETVGKPSQWPNALQLISEAMQSAGAVLFSRRDDGALTTIASPSLVAAQRAYDEGGWWQHDFLAERAIDRGFYERGDIVLDTDVSTEDERRQHPFYVGFREPNGLGGLIAGSISPVPSTLVVLSVQQAAGSPEYTEQHVKVLATIIKHCERAMLLSCQIADLNLVNATLVDTLRALKCSILILDHAGRCIQSNACGDERFSKDLAVVDGRLWLKDIPARLLMNAAIDSALHHSVGNRLACSQPFMVPRSAGQRPLVFYVLPLRTELSSAAWSPVSEAAAIVIIADVDPSQALPPALVRDFLGLTLGEARVASQIGLGLSPRDTAHNLGISEHTVRTTLKSIFAKTGVSRQPELVAALSTLGLLASMPSTPQ